MDYQFFWPQVMLFFGKLTYVLKEEDTSQVPQGHFGVE